MTSILCPLCNKESELSGRWKTVVRKYVNSKGNLSMKCRHCKKKSACPAKDFYTHFVLIRDRNGV